jgi:hypothetical protein
MLQGLVVVYLPATNYPGLVDGGQVQIDDNQSGLSDKQRAVGSKIGIGIRERRM